MGEVVGGDVFIGKEGRMNPGIRKALGVVAPIALVLGIGAADAAAQGTGTVRGTVTDARTSRQLTNVLVQIVGTRMVVVTDVDGRYLIPGVPVGEVEVRATRIGYTPASETITVALNSDNTVDFQMRSAAIELEGLVVTATGEQLRREVGNAIATINVADEVDQAGITTFSDVITARATGVDVLPSGGTLGSGSKIRIRGNNSVSLNNDPVIYIDGIRVVGSGSSFSLIAGSSIPLTGGQAPSRFQDIDPEQIESIEIIKGPSAATLYGTQAANGVIWITTKRGRAGRPQWNASFEAGVVTEPNAYPANFRGFDSGGNDCLLVDVAAGSCTQARVESFNPLENPSSSPFRNGGRQSVGLDVSGGQGGFTYYIAGRYTNEDGVMRVNDLQQARLRANFGVQASDRLNFDISTGYVSSRLALPLNDNFGLGTITNGLAGFWTDTLGAGGYGEFAPATLFTIETTQDIERFTTGLTTTWTPADFLSVRGNVGLDQVNRVDNQFFPTGEAPDWLGAELGRRISNRTQARYYTADFRATANTQLSQSMSSRTTAGAQYLQNIAQTTFAQGDQLVAGSRSIAAAAVSFSGEATTEAVTVGAFVEQQVGFNNRLYLTGALRADDNSAFGNNFDIVLFPKLSGSWVLSEESFFPTSLFSSFRFRAAWGESGLQPGTNDAIRFFTPVAVTADGQDVTGVTFGGLGNPSLEPERSREVELGFDAQFGDARAGLEVTFYDKRTRDALVFRQLPLSLGVSTGRFENLGSVRNTGLEALLRAKILESPSATWDVVFNGSVMSNELLSLGQGIEPIILGSQRHVEGFPLGGYWDLPLVSFNDSDGDGILATGDVVVGDSAVFLGAPFPKRSLSIQSSLMIGSRIRISGLMDYRGGQKLWNNTASWRTGQNTAREQNDPTASIEEQAHAIARQDFGTIAGYVEDASFWKLREVAVTFIAPVSLARRLGANRLSLTLSGRNLATFTSYTGLDPEISQSGQTQNFATSEFMSQPPVRYWTARVNLGF